MTYRIYVVMDGEDENRRISKIFRDLTRAQEYVRQNQERRLGEQYENPTIEEWTIV